MYVVTALQILSICLKPLGPYFHSFFKKHDNTQTYYVIMVSRKPVFGVCDQA